MVSCTRRQIIDHIHRLLAIQLKRNTPADGKCVLRHGQIRLVEGRQLRPTDLIIIDHVRSPDTVPLRTVIHQGVDENWDVLNDLYQRSDL